VDGNGVVDRGEMGGALSVMCGGGDGSKEKVGEYDAAITSHLHLI